MRRNRRVLCIFVMPDRLDLRVEKRLSCVMAYELSATTDAWGLRPQKEVVNV